MYKTGIRTVSLWGESIREESTYNIRTDIADILNSGDEDDWITLEINSSGGDFAQGMALYDWLILNVPKLQTIGYGSVNSMAIILFLAGRHRVSTKNTRFLLHSVSDLVPADVSMNPKSHMESAKSLLVVQKMYTDIMMERMSATPDRKALQDIINKSTIVTPKRAKKWGLIHEIC
jgi:ATP-dependent Clp protease, protease subunit